MPFHMRLLPRLRLLVGTRGDLLALMFLRLLHLLIVSYVTRVSHGMFLRLVTVHPAANTMQPG